MVTADSTAYPASSLAPEGTPQSADLAPIRNRRSLRAVWRGKKSKRLSARPTGGFASFARGLVRDGGNYVREEIEILPQAEGTELKEIVWLQEELPAAKIAGTVEGVPILAENFFLGSENPHARVSCKSTAICRLPCPLKIPKGEKYSASFVVGVAPAGQLRRGFLYYVEHERACPYRPFLHYNSWYDISWDLSP